MVFRSLIFQWKIFFSKMMGFFPWNFSTALATLGQLLTKKLSSKLNNVFKNSL
jgi:hypothetical protein